MFKFATRTYGTPDTRRRRARRTEADQRRRRHDAALIRAVGSSKTAAAVRPLITQIDLADGSTITNGAGRRPQFFFVLGGRVALVEQSGPVAVLPEGTVFGDQVAPTSNLAARSALRAVALGHVTLGVATEVDFDSIVVAAPGLAVVRPNAIEQRDRAARSTPSAQLATS